MHPVSVPGRRRHVPSVPVPQSVLARKMALRRLFFSRMNHLLDPAIRIPLNDISYFGRSLLHICVDRVLSHVQPPFCRRATPQPVRRIYAQESLLLNQFFKQCRHPRARLLAERWEFDRRFTMLEGYRHPAAVMVSMIFNGKDTLFTPQLQSLLVPYAGFKTPPARRRSGPGRFQKPQTAAARHLDTKETSCRK